MNTLPADLLPIFTANASLLPGCANLVRRPFSAGIRQLLRQTELTLQVIRTGPAKCVNALKRERHQVSGVPFRSNCFRGSGKTEAFACNLGRAHANGEERMPDDPNSTCVSSSTVR
jgi:hypothetical protein